MKIMLTKNDENKFDNFYQSIPNKKNIIYMFFTTNLLHYSINSTKLIPEDVNFVIISSGLTKEEEEVIEQQIKRPYCNLTETYNDVVIWNLLILKSQENFGWIDVDCFIFNPMLFYEIQRFANDKIAINTLWARKYEHYYIDMHFANTFFQFINIKIAKKMLEAHKNMTMLPVVFNINDDNKSRIGYRQYECLDKEQLDYIREYYPDIDKNFPGYDTTHYYQILLHIHGYKIHRIRDLDQLAVYYSEEAIHLGGCHRIHQYKLQQTLDKIYFRFNMRYSFYLLLKYLPILPDTYTKLYDEFCENLALNGINRDPDDIRRKIVSYANRHLISMKILF